ncbi:MAG: substrate-binding domain-containing protein [Cyanobacteria bacterium P01_A01_bin.68]
MSSLESFYKEYDCFCNAPLSCKNPLETAQQMKGAKFCLECGFPATLSIGAEIKGQRGNYKVTKFLGVRGLGRLYEGIHNQEAVIIKEYLLPKRCFNQDETSNRKETFKRVAGVNLADGREQNFRLIQTWEAICDLKGEHCYLITKDTEPTETLGQYLINQGAMKAPQVREFLIQSLQTLIFLHTQKLRFPSSQVEQGLEHGNINLDSVLIKLQSNKQFFTIFFCDLAKWENLFIPAKFPQPQTNSYKQDLESLGLLAFYLWLGRTTHHHTGKKIEPAEHELLPDTDNGLKQFIYRLLGFDVPFEDADTARQALLELSVENQEDEKQHSSKKKRKKKKRFPVLFVLLGFVALLLLGGGILSFILRIWKVGETKDIGSNTTFKDISFSQVPNIDSGDFFYTSARNSSWSSILKKSPVKQKRLEKLLEKPIQDVNVTFKHVESLANDNRSPIEKVQSKDKDFAIVATANPITKSIGDNMDSRKIAYDGLIVFVGSRKNNNRLVKALGGKITREQLRKIYTGKIKKWSQIAKGLKEDIDIEFYFPIQKEAVDKFEQLIFEKDSQDINIFRGKKNESTTKGTTETIRMIRQRVDDKSTAGIIGFNILSKTKLQCGVYPLAIADENSRDKNQPLFNEGKRTPLEISDDLCDKDTYYDVKNFKKYPLKYDLHVVYSKDRSSKRERGGLMFASLLKSGEGQCLLKEANLVPLQPIPSFLSNHACKPLSKP